MSLNEATLVEDVASRLFAPSSAARTIGAELELIPIVAGTKLPARIDVDGGAPSLSGLVRAAAVLGGWIEIPTDSGAPSWRLPDGGRLSFEPGGQIEISSAPHHSCSALIESVQQAARILQRALDGKIELLSLGVDPLNAIESAPLQLHSERYARMTRYLDVRGESGIRMMRQTAALQISVEHGLRPLERWQLLNAVAPYIIALFANSSRYAGRDTGHASYRAHFWRELDDSRTGIPFDGNNPVARYAEFALEAGALRAENGKGELHQFRSLLGDKSLSLEDWHFHLSTLFPEVRPKEYFEIRSADTIDPAYLAAPITFVAGLTYDDVASREALELLGLPDISLLRPAGRDGLGDPGIKARAADLVSISLRGASRQLSDYLSEQHLAEAASWLTRRLTDA